MPLSQALGANSYELNKQTSAKYLSQKQLTQFEMHSNSLKHRIDYELSEFDFLVGNLVNARAHWQQFTSDRTNSIRALIEAKAQLAQTEARKKARLAERLGLKEGQRSLEEICGRFSDSKLVEFERVWSKFMEVKETSTGDEVKKREITRLTNGETENLELNGADFMMGDSHEEMNKRILQYVFENIDKNAALRNVNLTRIKNYFEFFFEILMKFFIRQRLVIYSTKMEQS